MLAYGRLVASRGFHSLNQIEVKPNSATVADGWEFEREIGAKLLVSPESS
jgi:hypothetical protein